MLCNHLTYMILPIVIYIISDRHFFFNHPKKRSTKCALRIWASNDCQTTSDQKQLSRTTTNDHLQLCNTVLFAAPFPTVIESVKKISPGSTTNASIVVTWQVGNAYAWYYFSRPNTRMKTSFSRPNTRTEKQLLHSFLYLSKNKRTG